MQTFLALVSPALTLMLTVMAGFLVNALITAIENHTAIRITEQQRALLVSGADNAAGTLITMLLAKTITPAELADPKSTHVTNLAGDVIERMPAPAAKIGVTKDQMAQVIVGRAGQLLAQQPTPAVMAVAA